MSAIKRILLWSFGTWKAVPGVAALHWRQTRSESNAQERAASTKPWSIWVHGYARSGTSTVLSFFADTWSNNEVFALFEPCHRKDVLSATFANRSCGDQLLHYSACNFSFVRSLHGWTNRRSRTRGAPRTFTPSIASSACQGARTLVFKTITHPYEIFDVAYDGVRLLEREPKLRLLDVVRDPRSIYASMLTTEPFRSVDLNRGHDPTVLTRICDSFAAGLAVRHPRLHRLVFERLVSSPEEELSRAFAFAGAAFGEAQRAWIHRTLRAEDCSHEEGFSHSYRDCHTELTTRSAASQWRSVLTPNDLAAFSQHSSCQVLASAYGYEI